MIITCSTDNIARMFIDGECELFSIFKIVSNFNLRSGLQIFDFKDIQWTSNFRKSYQSFFKQIDSVHYTENDDAIITIVKTRMEQLKGTDRNVEMLLFRINEKGIDTLSGLRDHIDKWIYNHFEKKERNYTMLKSLHPSLVEGDEPVPMDIGNIRQVVIKSAKSETKIQTSMFPQEEKLEPDEYILPAIDEEPEPENEISQVMYNKTGYFGSGASGNQKGSKGKGNNKKGKGNNQKGKGMKGKSKGSPYGKNTSYKGKSKGYNN
jgi:hypothetical protein